MCTLTKLVLIPPHSPIHLLKDIVSTPKVKPHIPTINMCAGDRNMSQCQSILWQTYMYFLVLNSRRWQQNWAGICRNNLCREDGHHWVIQHPVPLHPRTLSHKSQVYYSNFVRMQYWRKGVCMHSCLIFVGRLTIFEKYHNNFLYM